VMVYSASIAMPDSPKYAAYHDYAFLMRHCVSLGVAFIAAVIAFRVPVSTWDKYAPHLFLIALVGLVIVLIPHVGKGVNGARRWIPLGITNMQPSEIMKLAVTIYAANYTVRKQEYMQSFAKGFLPMAFAVGLVGALLLLEPDMGAFMVVAAIAMGVLFLGGVNGKLFGGLVATAVGTFTMLVWLSPWRRERIFAYLDPWDERYAQGKAYQLTHSLIAFGRGEWFGVGLGGSVEKLNYLPEAHTDFILAVIGEELGVLGIFGVLSLYAMIMWAGLRTARRAAGTYAKLLAAGLTSLFLCQAMLNIFVVLGLAPLTGVPLPFISYGATNLTVLLAGMGLLLNVAAGGSAHLRVVEGSRRHGSDDRHRRGRDSRARGAGAGRRRRAAG